MSYPRSGIFTHETRPTSPDSEINLISKLQQRSVMDYIHQINWDERGSSHPMVVEFDPTTACNLACPACISRDLLNQGFFSRKRIRQLTQEIIDAGVKAVVLIGGGEPLAHPEINWVIEHLGNNNVQLGITTNGLLIDKHLDVIARHASWVRVSIDAATAETFQRVRPSHSGLSEFDRAIRNMKLLSKVKQGKMGYSFMIYSEGEFDKLKSVTTSDDLRPTEKSPPFSNVHEIYAAAQLAKEIGCDYFEVKPMYDIRHFAIAQRRELIAAIKHEIERAMSLTDRHFRVMQATKLPHTLKGDADPVEPKSYTRCRVAQMRTLITPSGTYVCPYFRGRNDQNIGDVNKMSLLDMWHGETRSKVMRALNPAEVCMMHCIRHESNLFLEEVISGKEVDVVDDFDFFI